jgi:1,4-alpha-glucan branching enzyme
VEFKLAASEAQSVSVAGSFNNWDVKRTPLRKEVNCWTTVITLPRGNYEYRFVVDGKWMDDPGAKESIQNPFGGRNAVLII